MKQFFYSLLIGLLTFSSVQSYEKECYAINEFDPYAIYENSNEYCDLIYFKVGGGLVSVGQESQILPVFGVGKRLECCEMGIDYSASMGYVNRVGSHNHSVFIYTLPKITCLVYNDPSAKNTLYYGGGASWSGIINNNNRQIFHGVFIEGLVGYELQRNCSTRTFLQLDISQPILSAYRKGSFPTPTLHLVFGVGY